MDRYQKVEKPKPESPINENEIRITAQGAIRNYISYATTLLQEKRVREIVLKAMGQAISKTVAIAEILKHLHQDTAISSVSITDVWEPIEEGLEPVEMTRHVSMISITLSTRELNKNSPGYQTPYIVEQTKPQSNYQRQQPKQGRGPYNAVNEDSYGRGRGQGRGRGRNWGRGGYGGYGNDEGGYGNYQGGYGNYQGGYDNYHDNGGYSNRGFGSGRSRGGGYRGTGYERGGGRGYGRGRGRVNGRPRGISNQT
ncbi:Ribonuclease P protein subunit p25-like protein [Quillaja saponaria]|uniref:Ribonuclease P protein subunit p25-like protein n=1 Tax=Quillaja saponaria TaxID=32244 RepID=A0AAD7L2M0_QUISA|nr:Ribonuclease P protein subunit p25-like protein [Quillaja saponaria]